MRWNPPPRPPSPKAPWLDSLDDYQVRYFILDSFDPTTAAALLSVRAKYRDHSWWATEVSQIVDGLMFDSLNCLVDETWRDIWI